MRTRRSAPPRRARSDVLRASRESAPRRRARARRGPAGGRYERAARACSARGIDEEQRLAELDGMRVFDEDVDDATGYFGLDLVHALHRFDDADDLALLSYDR